MSLTLRPYQPTDAAVITSWLKSEYLMRQWCADRYERYPVTPEDMNSYHERYIDGQLNGQTFESQVNHEYRIGIATTLW